MPSLPPSSLTSRTPLVPASGLTPCRRQESSWPARMTCVCSGRIPFAQTTRPACCRGRWRRTAGCLLCLALYPLDLGTGCRPDAALQLHKRNRVLTLLPFRQSGLSPTLARSPHPHFPPTSHPLAHSLYTPHSIPPLARLANADISSTCRKSGLHCQAAVP